MKRYIKRIVNMDFSKMFKYAKRISKKTRKMTIAVIFDMINCSIKYGAGYSDYDEYEFYNMDKKMRSTYMTVGINQKMVARYNKQSERYKFQDKVVFNKIFHKYLKRDWIDLDICTVNDFRKFLDGKAKIIVKPTKDYAGNGIEIIKVNSKTNILKLYDDLKNNNQTLIEEVLNNHSDINKMYDKSLNTLRIITFCNKKQVSILKVVFKVGNGGVIDNFAQGGMYTFVDEKGVVYADAIDKDSNIIKEHPVSKIKFKGFKIPFYKEAIKLVEEAAKEIKDIPYVGWDVAITNDGPVIIEGNQSSGAFQLKASLNDKKTGDLPVYEKAMNYFNDGRFDYLNKK